MDAPLLDDLAAVVGDAHVLRSAELREGYERDWTGRFRGEARAVVRPADAAQVSAVIAACRAAGAAVVTQGGNTGLVGGGVPRPAGEVPRSQIVLSLRRLNRLSGVDRALAQLRAGAGVTLAEAQDAAREAGLDLALDLGARDAATLGGLAACDAGGLRALRHGTARRQLAGVEAVLADGSIVRSRMDGLVKDTAGYDLGALLCGSEGTLGVITEVRWSLAPRRDARATALVGLDEVGEAVALARALRPGLPSLEVCEIMLREGFELTLAHLGLSAPLNSVPPVTVLLECATPAGGDPTAELAGALAELADPDRAVLAPDAAGRARMMRIRDSHAEALEAAGRSVKLDVGIGLDALADLVAAVVPEVRRTCPDGRLILFGHLGDGNLHINVLPGEVGPGVVEALEDGVLALVADHGGTVSAEHGIGVHKVRHLGLTRSRAELDAMRSIKRALDPDGVLNPGVGLPGT